MISRRYYIDWLRIFAVAMLIPFHTGELFTPWPFHIKNSELSVTIGFINGFIFLWHMPLFFFLAGAGSYYALSYKNRIDFIKERTLRLLVPLVFGMLVIIPPQVYVERIFKNQFTGSFFKFYPSMFNGFYPDGNIAWNHLWFIAYLFVLTMILLPLFMYLKSNRGIQKISIMAEFLKSGNRIYIPVVLLVCSELLLRPAWPEGNQTLVSDWANIFKYSLIILFGFIYASNEVFTSVIEKKRVLSLVSGLFLCLLMMALAMIAGDPVWGYNPLCLLTISLRAVSIWFLLLAIMGYGVRCLTIRNRVFDYCVEAAFPFYIIHQTVLLIIAFYLVPVQIDIWGKYLLIIVSSFIGTLLLYEILVKRIVPLPVFFGMKARR